MAVVVYCQRQCRCSSFFLGIDADPMVEEVRHKSGPIIGYCAHQQCSTKVVRVSKVSAMGRQYTEEAQS